MAVRNYSLKRVFIDREAELKQLKDSFSRLSNNKGQIVLLKGEHGIGKSKLIEEFRREIENEDLKFLIGRCKRKEGRVPYEPIIEALNYKLRTSTISQNYEGPDIIIQMDPEEIDEGIIEPEIDKDELQKNEITSDNEQNDLYIQTKPMGLIPFSDTELEEEPDTNESNELPINDQLIVQPLPMGLIPAAFRVTEVGEIKKGRTTLFETMTKQLFDYATNSSVIMTIEDIQWASLASLDYFEFLIDQISNKPIMLILTLCIDDIDTSGEKNVRINELIETLDEYPNYVEIEVQRFEIENVNKMIKKTFSREDVPETFINQIYEKTEGNPLYIEDIIQALIEEDIIDASSYVWQTRIDVSQIKIPSSTREMLIARLGRLNKQILKVLGYAAVIGREFNYEILVELLEIPEEKLLDTLDSLLDLKLIHEDLSSEDEKFRFDNPLIQEIAYGELSRTRRRFLHNKIGSILEKKHSKDLVNVVFNLADHFSKGKDDEKALKYLIWAGDRATQIYAINDAQRYYLTALELLNRFDYTLNIQRKEIELLNNLGNTCKMLGDWDQALEYYLNIPKLIENFNNNLGKLKSEKKLREIIPQNWVQIKLSDTYWNLAELMRYKSDWENAEKNYKKSLLLSQEIENYHGIAQAECGRGYIDWRQGDYNKALEHYDICIDFATKINDLPVIAVTYIDIGNIYNYTGEWDQAIAYYKESIQHLDKISWLHEMGRAYNGLGEVYAKQENWSEALENFEKSVEISRKIGDSYKRGWGLFNAAECYANLGEFNKALEYCNLAEEILTRLNDRVGLGLVYRNFGIINYKNGNWDESKDYFKKSLEFLKQLNVPYEYGTVYTQYGLMLMNKGEIKEAKKCLDFALEVFKNMKAKVQIETVEKILESKKFKDL
jgi:predicted ATPase